MAIERRRASLRETESLQNESPIPQVQNVLDPSVPTSGAQLEHDISMISPNRTVGMRKSFPSSVGKVPKILLDITNQNVGQPNCLTPQKKFLNSIDTVEKVVMEELKKLKSTPGMLHYVLDHVYGAFVHRTKISPPFFSRGWGGTKLDPLEKLIK
ncbi:Protein POLYCHOME [Camellia lanceoleosa]|uniref:Protein POLYCHOME n=1 Tax=Camellia lanceoleosa TaxID=1840588 RepID=A0ACC0FQQ8_9ERIC|nr:Protein POLYCHOME [Camellia lanceoleosa]